MLKLFVFILHTGLQPIVAVKVNDNATLVKTMMAIDEICLNHETEIFLVCLHLEYRSVVVSEVVVGALPKVSVWFGDHFYNITFDGPTLRLACPFEIVNIQFDPSDFG